MRENIFLTGILLTVTSSLFTKTFSSFLVLLKRLFMSYTPRINVWHREECVRRMPRCPKWGNPSATHWLEENLDDTSGSSPVLPRDDVIRAARLVVWKTALGLPWKQYTVIFRRKLHPRNSKKRVHESFGCQILWGCSLT